MTTPVTISVTFELTIESDSSVSNLTVIEAGLPDDDKAPESVVSNKIHSAVRNAIYQHNNQLPVR